MHPDDTYSAIRRDLEQAKAALEHVLLDWMDDRIVVAATASALDTPPRRRRHFASSDMYSERLNTLHQAISLIEDLIDGLGS